MHLFHSLTLLLTSFLKLEHHHRAAYATSRRTPSTRSAATWASARPALPRAGTCPGICPLSAPNLPNNNLKTYNIIKIRERVQVRGRLAVHRGPRVVRAIASQASASRVLQLPVDQPSRPRLSGAHRRRAHRHPPQHVQHAVGAGARAGAAQLESLHERRRWKRRRRWRWRTRLAGASRLRAGQDQRRVARGARRAQQSAAAVCVRDAHVRLSARLVPRRPGEADQAGRARRRRCHRRRRRRQERATRNCAGDDDWQQARRRGGRRCRSRRSTRRCVFSCYSLIVVLNSFVFVVLMKS